MGRSRDAASTISVAIGVITLIAFTAAVPSGVPAQTDTVQQPTTDNTATHIQVYANGSARWTVQIRTRLDTDDRVEDYRAFQARFRNDTPRFLDPFRDRIRAVVREAANATGRDMAADDFTAATHIQEVPRRWGIVTFEFTWRGFGAQRDGAIVVGDVFEGGFFLAANDTLTVNAPPAYTVSSVDPEPAERASRHVTWIGREDFADQRPLATFVPATTTGTGSPAGGQPTQTAEGVIDQGTGPWIVLGVALILLAAGGLYLGWRRSRPRSPSRDGSDVAGGAGGSGITTDADRVRSLLQANAGQLRQADIRDELGWSSSKTSRVIADLVEENQVEKTRLGRENVIELTEE